MDKPDRKETLCLESLDLLVIAFVLMLTTGDSLAGFSDRASSTLYITRVSIALSGILLLLCPSNILRVIFFILVPLETAISFPFNPNHRLTASLISLLALGSIAQSSSRFQLSIHLRYLLVIIYACAAVAKLNLTFLDPDLSCSTKFFSHFSASYFSDEQTQFIRPWLPFLTIIIEFLLPLGLLFQRFLKETVLLGILFHFTLALDHIQHFHDFSAVMIGALSLSVVLCDKDGSRVLKTRAVRALFATGLCLLVIPKLVLMKSDGRVFSGYEHFVVALQLVFSAFVLYSAWKTTRTESAKSPPTHFQFSLLSIPLLICLLIGLGPYLGVRTRSSFTMYSNLQMEPQASNHLLIPHSLGLAGRLGEAAPFEINAGCRDCKKTLHEACRSSANRAENGEACEFYESLAGRLLHKALIFKSLGEEQAKHCTF